MSILEKINNLGIQVKVIVVLIISMIITSIILSFLFNEKRMKKSDFNSFKSYTVIKIDNNLKVEQEDYFIRVNSQNIRRYEIGLFKDDELNNIYSVTGFKHKCQYVYFDKSWYINDEQTKICTKNEAVTEIGEIIEEVNKLIERTSNTQNTWKN